MKAFIIIFIAYLGMSAYLFFAQRSFIYFPPPPNDHSYPEETFQFEKARVQVIVLNKGREKAILYFGGNAEAVEYNAPAFSKHFSDHTVYLVQYRGYGNSTGSPTEANFYADALAIFERIKQRHNAVSVIGRSLGSGVATFLASKKNVNTLILVTPFDSIEAVAQNIFPFFPVSLLLQDKYDSLIHVQKIKTPTLLLIADQDQVISLSHSQNLANAFNSSIAKTTLIPNTGHNTISHHFLYYTSIYQFIMTENMVH